MKENLPEELKDRYDRWNYLQQHGGSDPFWEDGCNMNLVRNHIINIKRKMQEQGIQSEFLNKETPPEVDNKYMAKPEEIRANAKKALEEYEKNKDYQYLVSVINKMNKRQIEDTCINNVIGYCRGLKIFIKEDSLVAMRRHERYEHYLESFSDCRKRVEKTLEEQEESSNVQLSIF